MTKLTFHRALTGIALAALCVAALVGARPAAAQSLLGQSINDSFYFPSANTLYKDNGTQTVTASGVTFNDPCDETTDTVTPTQITITQDSPNPFASRSFNGLVFTETGPSPVTITGATLDSSSTFSPLDITFTSDSVSVNFAGLSNISVGQFTTIDLTFAPSGVAATPEPSAWLAFALGALGLGALTLRAKKRAMSV